MLRFVAQLVEHVTLNHGVEGSIPSGPTKGVAKRGMGYAVRGARYAARSRAVMQSCSLAVANSLRPLTLQLAVGKRQLAKT